ncbi:MAG: hypothetical protein C4523_13970 [Myxococcales bacterium]|nr:MAG: hypothetical protein C4523_13970 [Myxococcales bacterium]
MRNKLKLTVLVVFIVAGLLAASVQAEPFVPKTGKERQAVILRQVAKRFVVDRNANRDGLRKLAEVADATIVIDDGGQFPPKSLVEDVAASGAASTTIVLPPTFAEAHLRRLAVIGGDVELYFRVDAKILTAEFLAKLRTLLPRRVSLEMPASALTAELLGRLDGARLSRLVLKLETGANPPASILDALGKKPYFVEALAPSDFSPEALRGLAGLKKGRVILEAVGQGPRGELVKTVNALGGLESGAQQRGLIKPEEIAHYTALERLRVLTMSLENWEVTETFIRLMNSQGEFH